MKLSLTKSLLLITALGACNESPETSAHAPADLKWRQLTPLPDKFGFAGAFAGVSGRALLVAGGANFPDGGAPWTGSAKVWRNEIYVLEEKADAWKKAGALPRNRGYGVSLTWKNTLICVGGSNEDGHLKDVLILSYNKGNVQMDTLPSLPTVLANACGAVLNDIIYIAGGLSKPDSPEAEKIFWSLDLQAKNPNWKQLESWPGPPRMLSVAGAQGSAFYLFSGVEQINSQRNYLKDAYKYEPEKGWVRIADLPSPVAAAPGPAYPNGDAELWIFGGDDGQLAAKAASLKNNHPGFSTGILVYNSITDTWKQEGSIFTDIKENASSDPNASTWAPVTTPLVIWNSRIVLPSGEVRPAVRTPRVLEAYWSTENKAGK